MKFPNWQICSTKLSNEIKQKQSVTDCLISKILYSKRLLMEHVEALEQCMQRNNVHVDDINVDTYPFIATEIFTTRNTCILVASTILEHFILPKAFRLYLSPFILFTSGFSVVYVVKNVFGFRNKIVESEVENLIRTIDEFGNCIRRNMTYFNEIIIMKQQELIESRQCERAWDCITAAKEVTEILYDATRKLEIDYPVPKKFSQYYAPMEELRDSEYFKNNVTDYSPKHIKEFHNIFAYVQSQFLMRLALTIATKPSLSHLNPELHKIDCLIRQLVQEEESHFKNLTIEQNKKKQLEIDAIDATRALQNRSGPVAVLQNSSLKLSACMVAVAAECQALDITLQRLTERELEEKDNTQQLITVANTMHSIESALNVCFDDFQRLMIVYNKFLQSKLNINENTKQNELQNTVENGEEHPESILRVEISPNELEKKDDFYAYMFDAAQTEEVQELQNRDKPEMEILNFEKRITRGKFQPVLKQLKNRIDPIRQVMLEKEREVLAAKGINVDELFGKETNDRHEQDKVINDKNSNDSDTESIGSADLEHERNIKKVKERDNFAEMRNFLAQKAAINLFKLDDASTNGTPNVTGEEHILESEC